MTAVCFVTMLLSLTLNISGGPLKTAAGYVFIPMQKGINSFGIHISDKVTEIRTLKMSRLRIKAQGRGRRAYNTAHNKQTWTVWAWQLQTASGFGCQISIISQGRCQCHSKGQRKLVFYLYYRQRKKDGVDVGMNVLAGSGLVGIVTDAGDNLPRYAVS